jgi:chlorophyllide a reductase subunit X
MRPKPLSQDGLLNLFSGDAVGRDVVLSRPPSRTCAASRRLDKPSLEVVYDDV